MNRYITSIYRQNEHQLATLLNQRRVYDEKDINDALRAVLNDPDLENTYKLRVIEKLLQGGANPDIRLWVQNNPAVYHAAEEGNIALVRLLIEYSCDVDALNDEDRCALHAAASGERQEHQDIITLLLSVAASANTRDDVGNTPLNCALRQPTEWQNDDIMNFLIAGTDLTLKNWYYETPLHIAVAKCKEKYVKLLLETYVQKDAVDINGDTALMSAADLGAGHTEIVQVLLDAGFDQYMEVWNKSGNRAIHRASAIPGGCYVVQMLARKGASINCRNLSGETPLFIAVDAEQDTTAMYLIQANSDVNVKGQHWRNIAPSSQQSVLQVAIAKDNLRTAWMLLYAGCQFDPHKLRPRLEIIKIAAPQKVQQSTMNSHGIAQEMLELIDNGPRSLKHICRMQIRKELGEQLEVKLERLTLPKQMKEFLFFRELGDINCGEGGDEERVMEAMGAMSLQEPVEH